MNRSKKLLFSVLILAVILVLISLLQARADDQFDPCAETKKEKAFLKSGTGRPTWYITCWPMRFHVVYDLEETYARYGSWPDDKVHIVFEGKYQGALKVNYDPNSKKEKKITSIWFMAPEPADNPNRTARIIKVDGTIVYGSYPQREDYKIYYLKNPSELVIDCSAWRPVISGGGKWGKWDKEEERFLFKSAYILIKDNLLPPNNSFWNGLIIKSEGGIFAFEILGNKEAFSREELEAGLKKLEFQKTFPVSYRLAYLNDDVHSIKGSIFVRISEDRPPKPGRMVVTPSAGLYAEMENGNITPQTKTYILTNPGEEPIEFRISKNADWIDLSRSNASLKPGEKISIEVKVKPPGKKKKGCQYYESTLSFINKTNGDGNTNRDVELGEVEKWQVDLTGFEMSELNPYWKVNMRPRMDLKMNFKLSGIFKLKRNKKCNWQSKEELITHANILNFTPIYKPIWALKIKKATPVNFRSVTNRVGKRLLVTVNGDKVKFHWGLFEPRVRVTKTLTDKGCKQEPKYCGKDVNHEHVLDSFQEQITSPWLTLKDGFSKIYPGEERNFGRADSSGEIWIQYTYTLKRVK